MNKKHINSEKGQAIVYLVLGIVVFLGFVALAIDGGMVLADRRHEQNSADAASLAGGGQVASDLEEYYINTKNWNCTKYDWLKNNAEVAASSRALANGYTISLNLDSDEPDSPSNYVVATCANKYIDITVDIVATTQSNFLQLIFPEALSNNVTAVTRVYPRDPVVPGNAIVALNSGACQGNQLGGIFYMNKQDSSTLNVYNGSIFSNGCLKCNGQPTIDVSCDLDADPQCNLATLGSFGYFEAETCNGSWTPPPTSPVDRVDPADFSTIDPNCQTYLSPTEFEKIYKKGALSGLYCIDGNVTINANDNISGSNVTIVIINGNLQINGGATVDLTASTDTHASPQIPGVLFYLPGPDPFDSSICDKNNAWPNVGIEGTPGNTMSGSIVAPCSSVNLLGDEELDLTGQIIGWNVLVGGSANTNVWYSDNYAASDPTKMELNK